VKPPYNINQATQDLALVALENIQQVNDWIKLTVSERERLSTALAALDKVKKVFPSDANFILAEIDNAHDIYNQLVAQGIIVRDRSKVILCDDCLRITVGTTEENNQLLTALEQI
ncbi:MAG: aminotransferase class I/II-fold pyridoxal phosphate-dependent enzyme, partial [Pedobacter sp.]